MITGLVQGVEQMLVIIIELPAAVDQSRHPSAVRTLAGKQSGAAGRTGRCSTKSLAKKHATFCQPLDIGGRHSVTVGLDIAASIMGMEINDIG